MPTPAMFLTATTLLGAAITSEALTRVSEVPEIASMALLSVVLAGVSVLLRRMGTKSDDRGRRESGTTPRP